MRLSPTSFRLASLVLEIIERRKLSLDTAFKEALNRLRPHSGVSDAYMLTTLALRRFAEADLLLKLRRKEDIPLRRKCAFRVAYALLKEGIADLGDMRSVRGGLLGDKLLNMLSEGELINLSNVVNSLTLADKLSTKYSTPRWIVKSLLKFLGQEETINILKSEMKHKVWIRVNTLKTEVEKVLKNLSKKGIKPRIDKDYSFLLDLGDITIQIDEFKAFKKGDIIFQDKGSVVVVGALDPQDDEEILDMAAAPGVKTSLLQQLRGNRGTVIAIDISSKRVRSMRVLLNRLMVKNVNIVIGDATREFLRGKYDKVIIDAPCTNSGAIRQDPALRLALWRKPDLEKYYEIQHSMLLNGINLLKKGGTLVFSTCSYSEVEGEKHFEKELKGIMLDPRGIRMGKKGYRGFKCAEHVRRLFPHLHGTIGFFIARLTKER